GVSVFFERVAFVGRQVPGDLQWAAVGPGTADALHAHGIEHVWIPTRYLSDALGDGLPAQRGESVLRIRADAASPVPAARIRSRGIIVHEIVAYRTVEAPPDSVPLLREAFAGGIDGVVFTSASTVRGFAKLIEAAEFQDKVLRLTVIAIGPVTADAIRALGWPVHLVADEYSVDGIAATLRRRQANASGIVRS
ncbi:MAG TPA: uroporphyrinogen-III synthase, partial [bacterium]|nr:uroporphyrinogen-III synthase [bacterium]